MFIIIESGMALFTIQLVRVVLLFIPEANGRQQTIFIAKDFAIIINQMLNVIIIKSRSVYFDLFCLLISFTWLGHRTNDNFGAGSNEIVL